MQRIVATFVALCIMVSLCACGMEETVITSEPTVTVPAETDMGSGLPIDVENVEYVYAKESWEEDKLVIKVRNVLDKPLKSVNLNIAYLDESGDITDSRVACSNAMIESGQAINLEVEFWDGVPYEVRIVNGYYTTNTEAYVEFYLDEPIYFNCLATSEENGKASSENKETEYEDHEHILGGWMILSSPGENAQGTMVQCCTVCNEVMNYKTVDFHIASDKLENPGESIAWKKSADILQTYANHLPANLSLTWLTMEDFTIATIYADSGEELASVGFMDEEGNTLTLGNDAPVCMLQVLLDVSCIHTDVVDEAIIALMQLCNPMMTEDQALFFFTQLKYDLLHSSQSDENAYAYCETNGVTFVLMEEGRNLLNLYCLFQEN